jgi:hypothetical protein
VTHIRLPIAWCPQPLDRRDRDSRINSGRPALRLSTLAIEDPELADVTRILRSDQKQVAGPWDDRALEILRLWDPEWANLCVEMSAGPWNASVLPRKFVELIGIAVNVACTNLNHAGTRRHIQAAIAAGATRDEILMIFKMAALLAIQSCSHGAPI